MKSSRAAAWAHQATEWMSARCVGGRRPAIWADTGITGVTVSTNQAHAVEVMAGVAELTPMR